MTENCRPVSSHSVKKSADGLDGDIGRGGDAFQEKRRPPFPISIGTHCGEAVIVLALMLFQVKTQVEDGARQDAPMLQEKADQESADAAVPVKVGMDRFKLDMNQSDSY